MKSYNLHPSSVYEQNRRSWNAALAAHNSHKGDPVKFFAGRGNALSSTARELLGDLSESRVLHLMCNDGREAISMANCGADIVGVDFSSRAIRRARDTASRARVKAHFECAETTAWCLHMRNHPRMRFDIIFLSLGSLWWVASLSRLFSAAAKLLRPHGSIVVLEFHPLLQMLSDDWHLRTDYVAHGAIRHWPEGIEDYYLANARTILPWSASHGITRFRNTEPVFEFVWSLSDIFTAILKSGANISLVREYEYIDGEAILPRMRRVGRRSYGPPPEIGRIPLMFGLRATLPLTKLANSTPGVPPLNRKS